MNAKKFRDDTKGWIGVTTMFILMGIIIISWSKIFLGVNDAYLIAIIGFFGSIIGGAITLLGVKMTLDKDEKKRLIDTTPLKIRRIDKIIIKIRELNQAVVSDHSDQIKQIVEYLLDESAQIDGWVYSNIKSIELGVIVIYLDQVKSCYTMDNEGILRVSDPVKWMKMKNDVFESTDYVVDFLNKYSRKLYLEYSKEI